MSNFDELSRLLETDLSIERILKRWRRPKFNDSIHVLQRNEDYIDQRTFSNLEPSMGIDENYHKFKHLKKSNVRFACRKL